jgi:hypothetical protein
MSKCVVGAAKSISGTIARVTRFGQRTSGHKKQKVWRAFWCMLSPTPKWPASFLVAAADEMSTGITWGATSRDRTRRI